MGDVVDFKTKVKKDSNPAGAAQGVAEASIVEIAEKRAQAIQEDRRKVKRTMLTEFISGHLVVPGGLLKIALSDINENGLAFDLEEGQGHFNPGDSLEMRIYLNHQTFFPIEVKLAHVRKIETEGIYRHGCVFLKETLNSQALFHFVKFLEEVTASYRRDNGDVLVSKINS